jgi:hypothetical protein
MCATSTSCSRASSNSCASRMGRSATSCSLSCRAAKTGSVAAMESTVSPRGASNVYTGTPARAQSAPGPALRDSRDPRPGGATRGRPARGARQRAVVRCQARTARYGQPARSSAGSASADFSASTTGKRPAAASRATGPARQWDSCDTSIWLARSSATLRANRGRSSVLRVESSTVGSGSKSSALARIDFTPW